MEQIIFKSEIFVTVDDNMDDAIDYFSSPNEKGKIINEDTVICDTQVASLNDEKEKNEFSSIQNYDPFYKLPDFARTTSKQPCNESNKNNECVLPLLRRVIPALETSAELCAYQKNDCLKKDVIERITLLRSLENLAWTGHMIKLNMLADEPLIQSLILSIYQVGPLYIDPYRLYQFFSLNFTILPLNYDDVWTSIDRDVVGKKKLYRSSHWRVRMIKIIQRVIRRREGPGPMVHLLLVALCRSLNVCSRLVISFPTSNIIKNAKNCNVEKVFNNFSKVSELSQEKVFQALKSLLLKCPSKQQLTTILKRMNISDSSFKKNVRRRKAKMYGIDRVSNENLDVKFWVEIFSSLHRRWIVVDLVKKKFDKSEAFNLPCESDQEETYYQKYTPEFSITRRITIKAKSKNSSCTPETKQALSKYLFLTSDSSSRSSVSDECEDITEPDEQPKHSELPEDSRVLTIDNNEIPLSPLNDDDMMLQQKCYAYTFSKCNPKEKASSPLKHSFLTDFLDTVNRSKCEKNLNIGLSKSEDSDILILGCSQYGILRDVTRRYQFKLWPSILEKRTRMVHTNFEFLLKQWNTQLSDIAVQERTVASDFTLVKATDNLDDYALQEQSQKEALPKSKSLFRKSALYALESLLPFTKIIYPRAPVLGYFYGEPVYPRKNVQEILTRKQWEETKNRVVCDGAQPIKIKKKKNSAGKQIAVNDYNEKILEFFGFWQTKERSSSCASLHSVPIPIPSSEYETVNLIGNRVVPTGCVHVRGGTGIVSVLRELKTIPWRLALVGFEYGKTLKPVYDGVVVWEKDSILVENRYKEVLKKKLDFLFKQHCEKIQKLWMQVLKTILGRYSLAVNERKYLQDFVSFKHARNAVDQVAQQHFEQTRKDLNEQKSSDEMGDPWETV